MAMYYLEHYGFVGEEESYLAHYGVKGMRWRHRKAENRDPRERYRTLNNSNERSTFEDNHNFDDYHRNYNENDRHNRVAEYHSYRSKRDRWEDLKNKHTISKRTENSKDIRLPERLEDDKKHIRKTRK